VAATSLALFERTLAVNLRGPFLTCRAVLPHMLAAGAGLVVNMVSTGAAPAMGAYLASKQGLLSLTQSLAAELGEGAVRVVALASGLVDTPGLRNATIGLAPGHLLDASLHPTYEGAMPAEEAGAAVAYLLSTGGADDHGTLVSAYALLERAGLLTPLAPGLTSANACPCAKGDAAHMARALSEQVHDASAKTEEETRRRPTFARPDAHSRLGALTGLSLDDWDTTMGDLERQLAAVDEEGPGQPVSEALHARIERLLDGLMLLRDYYGRLPAETTQFSADQELLRQVSQASARRVRLIDDLLAALGRV
jgi:Enoyl-(Acyl carrier protein) reductase